MPVIHCSLGTCGKSWNSPAGHFPLCVTNPCPLRAIQRQTLEDSSGTSLFQTTHNASTFQGICRSSSEVSMSLQTLRRSCGTQFSRYDMQGAQSATTTVTLPNSQKKVFRTKNQMHSEMVAIEWMLDQGHWKVFLGLVLWAHDHSSVTLAQFTTTEPHCGFCTIFLIAAGLPVNTPTCGNYQLASRLAFQLPVELEISPHFIARVLDGGCYCGFPALKVVLNSFVNLPSDQWVLSIGGLAYVDENSYIDPDSGLLVIDWFELVEMHKREVIYLAWKVIFERILTSNKQQG